MHVAEIIILLFLQFPEKGRKTDVVRVNKERGGDVYQIRIQKICHSSIDMIDRQARTVTAVQGPLIFDAKFPNVVEDGRGLNRVNESGTVGGQPKISRYFRGEPLGRFGD